MRISQDALHGLIEEKAKAAGITSQWQVEEAKDLFLPIFTWRELDAWSHAPTTELAYGDDRVLTAEIEQAAQGYMQRDWLQDERLDWMLADAMAFGEINSTFKTISPNRFYYYPDGSLVLWMMGLTIIFKLALWAGWLLIALMLYSEEKLLAAGWVGLTVAYQIPKRKRLGKLTSLLTAMSATYGGLDACPPSWRNLYALMEKSRDLGAKWPTQLYRLVEKRLAA